MTITVLDDEAGDSKENNSAEQTGKTGSVTGNTVEVKEAEHAKPAKKPAKRSVDIEDDEESEAEVAKAKSKNHDVALSGRTARVTFFDNGNEDDGDKPIFASLNGYAYQIPRGVKVDIPEELLEVFENSRSTLLSTGQNGEVKERVTNRFQYSVHGSR